MMVSGCLVPRVENALSAHLAFEGAMTTAITEQHAKMDEASSNAQGVARLGSFRESRRERSMSDQAS